MSVSEDVVVTPFWHLLSSASLCYCNTSTSSKKTKVSESLCSF